MEGKYFFELHQLIEEKNFYEYADLLDYLIDNNKKLYFSIASAEKNVLHFTEFLASRRRVAKRKEGSKGANEG